MKEKVHEQLSALVDNELGAQEQALLFRQIAADTDLSGRLSRYQLISDTLQNHVPSKLDRGFHRRIQDALADESPARTARMPLAAWFKPAAGLAIAASVAMVAVLTLQSTRTTAPDAAPAVASAPPAEDYIRAADNALTAARPVEAAGNLELYLVNHSEYALSRGILPYVHLVGHEMNAGRKE